MGHPYITFHLLVWLYIRFHRYSSRALLIPFIEPSLRPTSKEERSAYERVFELLDVLSTSAGAVVSMGKQFIEDHEEVVVNYLEPKVCGIIAGAAVLHRIQLAYSTLLLW